MSNNNIPVHLQVSKAITFSNQVSVASQSSGASSVLCGGRQRRSGSSFAYPPTIRHSTSSIPRINQSLRKQNKNSRRPKLAEEMSDTGVIRTSGRKGQTNITHLMNFTLPPRPYNPSYHGYAGHGSHLNRRSHHSWGYNTVDKAR